MRSGTNAVPAQELGRAQEAGASGAGGGGVGGRREGRNMLHGGGAAAPHGGIP